MEAAGTVPIENDKQETVAHLYLLSKGQMKSEAAQTSDILEVSLANLLFEVDSILMSITPLWKEESKLLTTTRPGLVQGLCRKHTYPPN